MAIDERERHRLHERLDEVLGPEEAVTLMRHLPPVGWGDVARRTDFDQLESRVDASLHRDRVPAVGGGACSVPAVTASGAGAVSRRGA